MDAVCDLHTHSTYSDGTCTPAELVEQAEQLGLGALALTDHNTGGGLREFMERGQGSPVETIAGAEFSTEHNGREVHLTGLFIAPEHYADVDEWARVLWKNKDESNRKLEAALRKAGYNVDYDALRKSTPGGQVNRALFASELERKGYMSINKAFATVLRPGSGLYVPPVRPDTVQTVRDIRRMGAVPVLAHPYLNLTDGELAELLPEAVDAGLGGIEVYYSTYTPEQTQKAKQTAERYGLAMSGGSDYHGSRKPDVSLGRGRGSLAVPLTLLEPLRNA